MSWLLEVDCVGKSFGRCRVLSSASLRAPKGAVTFLVGRGGAGKSTLLRIATGYLAADSGYVRFDGVTFLQPTLHRLARQGLFFLPDRDLLSHAFSVRRHLSLVRRRFGSPDGGVQAEEAVARTGLEAVVDRRPQSLSEGERRRAEMAVALVRNPRCLLADEPFRHLAPLDAEVVGAALRLLASRGCAVVVTGHEVPSLFEVADRVTWCASGTTYELGSVADARVHWQFCRDYLGVTPTARGPARLSPDTAPPGGEPGTARD